MVAGRKLEGNGKFDVPLNDDKEIVGKEARMRGRGKE